MRHRLHLLVLLAVSPLIAGGCGPEDPVPQAPPDGAGSRGARGGMTLTTRVPDVFAHSVDLVRQFAFLPTLSVALVDQGGVRWIGTSATGEGSAAEAWRQPSPSSRYCVESLSKPLAALALLNLLSDVQPGQDLRLMSECQQLLPAASRADPVTFQDVLCHHVFVAPLLPLPPPPATHLPGLVPGCDYSKARPYEEVLALSTVGPRTGMTPVCGYDNNCYWVAGWLLAHPALQPSPPEAPGATTYDELARLMSSRLFEPLGMKRTALMNAAAARSDALPGGDWLGSGFRVLDPVCHENLAAEGVLSTAEDVARLMLAMLNEGRLDGQQALPPTVVAQACEPGFQSPPCQSLADVHFTPGWWRYRNAAGTRDMLWHEGWSMDTGVAALVALDLIRRTGFCALVNTYGSADTVRNALVLGGHGSGKGDDIGGEVVFALLLNLAELGFDALAGELPAESAAPAALNRARMLGFYRSPDGTRVAQVYEQEHASGGSSLAFDADRRAALLVPRPASDGVHRLAFSAQLEFERAPETLAFVAGRVPAADALERAAEGGATERWPRELEPTQLELESLDPRIAGEWEGRLPPDPIRELAPWDVLRIRFGRGAGDEAAVSLASPGQFLQGEPARFAAVFAPGRRFELQVRPHGLFGSIRLRLELQASGKELEVEWLQGSQRRRATLRPVPPRPQPPGPVRPPAFVPLRGTLWLGGQAREVELLPAAPPGRPSDLIRIGGAPSAPVALQKVNWDREGEEVSFVISHPGVPLVEFHGRLDGSGLRGTARGGPGTRADAVFELKRSP